MRTQGKERAGTVEGHLAPHAPTPGEAPTPAQAPTPPTVTDVALAAGVSTATVSRVLNDNPKVDAKLARRVRAAIDKLGYEPSRVARSLRVKRSQVWALVIPELQNPFFTDMISGVEDVARAAGFMLFLCNAGNDVGKEASYLRLAVAEHVAGIILSPSSQTASARALGTLGTTPVVTVDRHLGTPVDWVGVNNRQGAEMAVHHLADNGYRRIACISGPGDTSTGAARLAGYRRALAERCVNGGPELVREGDFGEEHGFRAMSELLRLRRPPDAVFAANNLLSLGALQAINDAGAKVPDDIAIVGFDDMPWAPLVKTPLTAVAQPTYEIGRETARLLLGRVGGDIAPPREIMLAPKLVVRGSSASRAGALPDGASTDDRALARAGTPARPGTGAKAGRGRRGAVQSRGD